MKLEQQSPIIKDPETEAAEFESMPKNRGKAIREANKKPAKSGLTYIATRFSSLSNFHS